jgi:hypothetical protein
VAGWRVASGAMPDLETIIVRRTDNLGGFRAACMARDALVDPLHGQQGADQ